MGSRQLSGIFFPIAPLQLPQANPAAFNSAVNVDDFYGCGSSPLLIRSLPGSRSPCTCWRHRGGTPMLLAFGSVERLLRAAGTAVYVGSAMRSRPAARRSHNSSQRRAACQGDRMRTPPFSNQQAAAAVMMVLDSCSLASSSDATASIRYFILLLRTESICVTE
ncbi:unnamed protein product [Urochloa humidicola]